MIPTGGGDSISETEEFMSDFLFTETPEPKTPTGKAMVHTIPQLRAIFVSTSHNLKVPLPCKYEQVISERLLCRTTELIKLVPNLKLPSARGDANCFYQKTKGQNHLY
ncbi:MAG: hypothetical protein C4288_16930 [Leptolyngbya sp. ERB_1_1]